MKHYTLTLDGPDNEFKKKLKGALEQIVPAVTKTNTNGLWSAPAEHAVTLVDVSLTPRTGFQKIFGGMFDGAELDEGVTEPTPVSVDDQRHPMYLTIDQIAAYRATRGFLPMSNEELSSIAKLYHPPITIVIDVDDSDPLGTISNLMAEAGITRTGDKPAIKAATTLELLERLDQWHSEDQSAIIAELVARDGYGKIGHAEPLETTLPEPEKTINWAAMADEWSRRAGDGILPTEAFERMLQELYSRAGKSAKETEPQTVPPVDSRLNRDPLPELVANPDFAAMSLPVLERLLGDTTLPTEVIDKITQELEKRATAEQVSPVQVIEKPAVEVQHPDLTILRETITAETNLTDQDTDTLVALLESLEYAVPIFDWVAIELVSRGVPQSQIDAIEERLFHPKTQPVSFEELIVDGDIPLPEVMPATDASIIDRLVWVPETSGDDDMFMSTMLDHQLAGIEFRPGVPPSVVLTINSSIPNQAGALAGMFGRPDYKLIHYRIKEDNVLSAQTLSQCVLDDVNQTDTQVKITLLTTSRRESDSITQAIKHVNSLKA